MVPDYNLWKIAARYQLHDLEYYCRSDEEVLKEIKAVISSSKKGINSLLESEGIPLSMLSEVVATIFRQMSRSLLLCQHPPTKTLAEHESQRPTGFVFNPAFRS